MLCERPPALLTPPNVIITPKEPETKHVEEDEGNKNNNNLKMQEQSMKVRLVEVGRLAIKLALKTAIGASWRQ